jgi:cell division protein FtsI/penicillin-binding protein 2
MGGCQYMRMVQGYRNRQALVKICFILIVLIFTYRAFSVSEIQANDISLKTKASKNSEFALVEKSMRGNILDRNNNLLAILTLVDKAKKVIGMKPTIKESIEVNECSRQKIAGVAIESSGFRYYPKKDSIAPLIGKINSENIGVFGIEAEYDRYLAGVNGIKRIADNKNNSNIYYDAETIKQFEDGENLTLTIDSDIQFHVFNAIKEQAEFHEADSAAAIVLSPNGEILALANYPSTNPNNLESYSALSILSIHWHHEMYLLHREEKTLKAENEKINALNRQLLMEYSEIQSGVNVYQKSKEELMMFVPLESEWEDVSI